MLNSDLLDTELFRREFSRLLLIITTLLPDKRPSLSPLPLMMLELDRTLLRRWLSKPQSSLLLQYYMLPFFLSLFKLDLLPLTLLFRPSLLFEPYNHLQRLQIGKR